MTCWIKSVRSSSILALDSIVFYCHHPTLQECQGLTGQHSDARKIVRMIYHTEKRETKATMANFSQIYPDTGLFEFLGHLFMHADFLGDCGTTGRTATILRQATMGCGTNIRFDGFLWGFHFFPKGRRGMGKIESGPFRDFVR